ncbi:MAG: pilin [Candidatus Pacebacteria bacterium]|nr:pilin [Candidatus Paceibacterota bacterium]
MKVKFLKQPLFVLSALLVAVFIFSSPVLATTSNNYGLDDTVNSNPDLKSAFQVDEINEAGGAENFIATKTGRVIGQVLSFLGVIFLILMIVGGIQWMTAGGNQEKVAKAKQLITSAIIGLVIVFSAYAVTAFIGTILIS